MAFIFLSLTSAQKERTSGGVEVAAGNYLTHDFGNGSDDFRTVRALRCGVVMLTHITSVGL